MNLVELQFIQLHGGHEFKIIQKRIPKKYEPPTAFIQAVTGFVKFPEIPVLFTSSLGVPLLGMRLRIDSCWGWGSCSLSMGRYHWFADNFSHGFHHVVPIERDLGILHLGCTIWVKGYKPPALSWWLTSYGYAYPPSFTSHPLVHPIGIII